MKKYVIGIGGTGIRCLESFIYLISAGLLGSEEVTLVTIDFDINNGNLGKLRNVIKLYNENNSNLKNSPIFKARLKTLSNEDINLSINLPGNRTFGNFLNYSTLSSEQQKIHKIFFTQSEINMNLEGGFRAHSGIGDIVMSKLQNDENWQRLTQEILNAIQHGEEVRVFVFASIFGGTGSSGFPFVGNSFRRSVNSQGVANRPNLKLGGALLLPYFNFLVPPCFNQNDLFAKSEYFLINTYSALQFYNLVWNDDKSGCPYDAIYFMGYDRPVQVEFEIFGNKQNNPLHIVNFLASLSALDFFQRQDIAQRDPNGELQSEPPFLYTGYNEAEGITWKDLPLSNLKKSMLYFTCFGSFFLNFFCPLIDEENFENKAYMIPWYHDFFQRKGINLKSEENKKKLESLKDFFEKFYFPFLKDIMSDDNVKLFRKDAFGRKDAIGVMTNDVYLEDPYDKFWDLTLSQKRVEGENIDKLVNLLYKSSVEFIDKYYFKTEK